MRLFSDFYTFWEKANFWYMNHDSIIIDGCLYFIECEILREDNRSRKCPIVTLFYKHSFGIKIDWLMCTFSGYSEDIARKCYIDLTGVHSCYGCNYDYFFFLSVEGMIGLASKYILVGPSSCNTPNLGFGLLPIFISKIPPIIISWCVIKLFV